MGSHSVTCHPTKGLSRLYPNTINEVIFELNGFSDCCSTMHAGMNQVSGERKLHDKIFGEAVGVYKTRGQSDFAKAAPHDHSTVKLS